MNRIAWNQALRRRVSVGTVTALLLVCASLPSPSPIAATGACGDTQYVNRFDGYSSSYQVVSSRGTIRDRPVFVCDDSNGATSGAAVWVMVADSAGNRYAQVGFVRFAGMSNPSAFTEYNDGTVSTMNVSHWWRALYGGIWSSGTQHAYSVDYNASTGKLYMSIDGLTKASTPWSPDTVFTGPWEGQWYGETLDRGDDVPGTAGARDDFSLVAVRHCAGCLWQMPTSNTVHSDESYYKFVWTTNPTAFQIYTSR